MSDNGASARQELLAEMGFTAGDEPTTSEAPCYMLSVEKKGTTRWCLAYSQLARIEFQGGHLDKMALYFASHRVVVHGSELDGLYRDLQQHRVARLCESTDEELLAEGPLVQHIAVEPNVPDDVPAMLSVETKHGQQWAFAYGQLLGLEFGVEQASELSLVFPEHRVTLKGRRLGELFQALRDHRVTHLKPASREELLLSEETEMVIEDVSVNPAG